MGWQPIETAPKDGTFILCCVAGCVPAVGWFESFPDEVHYAPQSQWRVRYKEDYTSKEDWLQDWIDSRYEPTHWMPLPEAPK